MEEGLCLGGIKEHEFELESEEEEEEEFEKLDQMKSPVAVNWIDGGLLKGVVIVNDDDIMRYKLKLNKSDYRDVIHGPKEFLLNNDKKRKRVDDCCQVFDVSKSNNNDDDEKEYLLHNKNQRKRDDDNHHTCCQVFDVCPICYEPWTNYGRHQLCSLPCGHIYGRSCINKWLLQAKAKAKSSSMKCPQCNNLCTLEDVRPLQASRLSIAEHNKSSSSSSTTRHFPFTKKGYEALKKYISRRTYVASHLASVTANQRLHVLKRAQDASRRLGFVRKRRDELLKCQIGGAEGPQADLFLQRADALDLRILPLTRRADALEQQVYGLCLQYHASRRLNDAYEACVDYFEQMCKRLDMDDVLIID